MKRFKRNYNGDHPPLKNDTVFKTHGLKMKMIGFLLASLLVLCVVFSISVILRDLTSGSFWTISQTPRVLDIPSHTGVSSEHNIAQPNKVPKDKLLGGLLASGFNEKTCISRYESINYRKEPSHNPSPYLISKLRSYEARHKHCGPNTEPYKRALERLKSGQPMAHGDSDCKYLVWISFSGLGNRILTLTSAFLYALLTDRVLLVDRGVDIPDLFCEPFPDTSWLLPLDFPIINQFNTLNVKSPERYGNVLKNGSSYTPPFGFLYLVHDYDFHDKLFFCEENQIPLQNFQWLVLKSDNYFTPSLFLVDTFKQELENLFPEKETVFHFLGRYLLHPTNSVWGIITRYYQAYLAKADEKVGIQVRIFDIGTGPFPHVLDQIIACTLTENLLPEVNDDEPIKKSPESPKTKAVLVTSLSSGYSDAIREKYWEHSSVTGEVIGVYQPSHEEHQQTGKPMHNKKAWAEMYLLSLMDKLVTSSWSTFGYVAQGLGGLRPWILYKPENQTAPDPPCRRGVSMEPCFHAPPFYDCKMKRGTDTGELVGHVRHCEDMSWGLKLVDGNKKI